MTVRKIDIGEQGRPTTAERLDAFEAKLGRKLPGDFRDFLLRHNGCALKNVLEGYDWPVFRCPRLAGLGCSPRLSVRAP